MFQASPSTLEADDSDSSPPRYLTETKSTCFSSSKTRHRPPEEIKLLPNYGEKKTNRECTQNMLQQELRKVIKKTLTKKNDCKSSVNNIKNQKKSISFKICNNPIVYTALVSYDNPTQSGKKGLGFTENRKRIKEALDDLTTRRSMCKHSSFWIKYNLRLTQRNFRPRKRNINISSLLCKHARNRSQPTRDLTAFMSSFYKIQRKGIRLSITKIYSTSKIGKILRKKWKVIRRRRVKNKPKKYMLSRDWRHTGNAKEDNFTQMQDDLHELTEVIVTTPRNNCSQDLIEKAKNRKNYTSQHNHDINVTNNYSQSTEKDLLNNQDKRRRTFSNCFNFRNPVVSFNKTNNTSPVLENKINYKRRKKDGRSLSKFFRIKRKNTHYNLKPFLDASECAENIVNHVAVTSETADTSKVTNQIIVVVPTYYLGR